MAPRGLFVGVSTLDLVQRVRRSPGPNEKVTALRCDIAAGGPATTAAVTFAALGGQAVLLSAFGPGPVAWLVKQDLEQAGVRLVDAWCGGADLSVSAITVLDGTGERSVVSRNAEDLRAEPPTDVAALLRTDVVLLDGHHPGLAVPVATAACGAGVPVVLDCGSDKPVYNRVLALTDAAVCSAAFTFGDRAGFDAIAAAVLAEGTRLVAMTDGAAPIRWRTGAEAGAVPVPEVPARDTLGAGDVLHGAVAFARARGVTDPQRLLAFGAEVAAHRVRHVGPRTWLAELPELVP